MLCLCATREPRAVRYCCRWLWTWCGYRAARVFGMMERPCAMLSIANRGGEDGGTIYGEISVRSFFVKF